MIKKRILPDNYSKINNYTEEDQNKIEQKYKKNYDKFEKPIKDQVQNNFKKDITSFKTHNRLLSLFLNPIISNGIKINHEVLFIDPLKYAKDKREIIDIPTFDFLLAEFDEKIIIRLIFVEIKGTSPKTDFTLKSILEYELNEELRKYLFQNIKKLNEEITISETIKFEYVLATQEISVDDFKDSIRAKKFPFIIWSVNHAIIENKYRINIVEDIASYHDKRVKIESKHKNRELFKFLTNTKFAYTPAIEFTPAMDITLIICTLKDLYLSNYGSEIIKERIIKMIKEIGFGENCDDNRILDWLYNKIISKGKEIGVIKKQKGVNMWKYVVAEEKTIQYRFRKQMKKKSNEIFSRILKEFRIKTIPKSQNSLDRFL